MPNSESLAAPRSLSQLHESVGLTWRHWLYFTLISLVLLTDGMDVTIVSHIFPSLVQEWGISIGGGITLIVTGGFVSMGIGAMVAGRLADLWGRKLVLVAATSIFGLGTALGATSGDFTAFSAWRFIACLGMGATMSTGNTLLADLVPARQRSAMLAAAYAAVGLGTVVGAVLAGVILPVGGWRTLLIVGGVIPLVLIVALAAVVPESPMYYAVRGSIDKAQKALMRLAPREDVRNIEWDLPGKQDRAESFHVILSKRFRLSTLLLWLFGFFSLGTQLLIAQYLPTLLQLPVPGLNTVQSSTIVGVYGLASVLGGLFLGAVLTKASRFVAIGMVLALSAVMTLVIGLMPVAEFTALIVLFAVAGLILPTACGPTRSVLASAAYPTKVRGTGIGSTEFSGRIGSAAGGAAGGTLIGAGLGLSGLFLTLLIPIAILGVTLAGLRSEAKRTGADSRAGYEEEAPVVSTAAASQL